MSARTNRAKQMAGGQEVDLIPIMNLIAIIIPVLLVSTEFLKTAMINCTAPRNVPEQAPPQQEQNPVQPLSLLLNFGRTGVYVNVQQRLLNPDGSFVQEADKGVPTVPKVNVEVCYSSKGGVQDEILRVWDFQGRKYVRAVRPIAEEDLNSLRVAATESGGQLDCRQELDHDYPRLNKLLGMIVDTYAKEPTIPDRYKVIINADQDTQFSTIVRAIDTARERTVEKAESAEPDKFCEIKRNEDGTEISNSCTLFPVVVLSAGIS